MKLYHFAFVLIICSLNTEALKDLIGTETQKCINCLCHARSGCWSRFNCARYSVNFDYWKTAGSPVLDPNEDPDSQESYNRCMRNENCILNTIDKYTSSFGQLDCNCDGKFDCKDKYAIHLKGKNCTNPQFGTTYARRFNRCAKSIGVSEMLPTEGYEGCKTTVESE